MSSQSYLAIDLGAESGRGVIGTFDGDRVDLREIGRFSTATGSDAGADGVQRWDIDRIYGEIDGLVALALRETDGHLEGIGVDSWGVDFGLFDADGKLLARPACYRDRSHVAARDEMLTHVTEEEIWDATGIQGMAFNSLYQIAAIQKREPELLEKATRLQLIPDVIARFLTNGAHTTGESSDASTSQMMHPGGQSWNTDLLDRLGLPSHFLPPIVQAGSLVGKTSQGVPVYAPATHDTASAVVAVPTPSLTLPLPRGENKDGSPSSPLSLEGRGGLGERGKGPGVGNWAFISSGTWSLFGAELPAPVMSREAMRLGFSNEAGVAGTTRFLKNIMGLWLVQQSRQSLKTIDGRDYTYPELMTLASSAKSSALFDAVHQRFLNPDDMVAEIRQTCRETGQPEPTDAGEIVRCCLESLALAYRRALHGLEVLLGRKFAVLHIIGGGSQNTLLNQWTADACGIPVLAGPSEATALGNVLGQMVGAGVVADWAQAREVSRRSSSPTMYEPSPVRTAGWAEREASAVKLWEKG